MKVNHIQGSNDEISHVKWREHVIDNIQDSTKIVSLFPDSPEDEKKIFMSLPNHKKEAHIFWHFENSPPFKQTHNNPL